MPVRGATRPRDRGIVLAELIVLAATSALTFLKTDAVHRSHSWIGLIVAADSSSWH